MSRPLKQGLDYFPHDTDATNDPKIKSLMALHGAEGYSFYFILLETIFRTENARITCGKPMEKAGLARSMCISLKKFDAILATALELGCFDNTIYQDTQCLTSNGIQKRIAKVNEVRNKERIRKENIKEKVKEKEKTTVGKRTENLRKTHGKQKTLIPHDFTITEKVKAWAIKKGLNHLEEHLESFISKCNAKGYQYVDWDSAFMEAIRGNWAKIEDTKKPYKESRLSDAYKSL
jgi:hypothetical protein